MEGFPHKMFDWFISNDIHKDIPYVIALHLATDYLWCGFGHKDNNFEVLADGQWVASRGHSVNYMTLHYNILPPWPPNILLAFIIPFSGNTLEFGAAQVRGPHGPISVALARFQGPSLSCNDPCDMLTSNVYASGTVLVGFTVGDVIAGRIMSLTDSLSSLAGNLLGDRLAKAFKLNGLAEGLIGELFGFGMDTMTDSLESSPDESFVTLSNDLNDSLSGLSEQSEIGMASEALGGPLSLNGGMLFFSQSEALSGD